jgi:hypothetical protein
MKGTRIHDEDIKFRWDGSATAWREENRNAHVGVSGWSGLRGKFGRKISENDFSHFDVFHPGKQGGELVVGVSGG